MNKIEYKYPKGTYDVYVEIKPFGLNSYLSIITIDTDENYIDKFDLFDYEYNKILTKVKERSLVRFGTNDAYIDEFKKAIRIIK